MPYAGEKMAPSIFPGIPQNAPPVSSSVVGTPSVGTTETFDVVLGYYQATLINGHRYRVNLDGLIGNCGVAGDIYTLQIRDSGSSSAPTSSSLLVASTQWTSTQAGTPSRVPIPLRNTFVASSSGIHTFGFSSLRTVGSGSFTPEPVPNLFRELYVEDLGGI